MFACLKMQTPMYLLAAVGLSLGIISSSRAGEEPTVVQTAQGGNAPVGRPPVVKGSAWTQTAAGNYNWADAGNWNGAVPGGKGAAADLGMGAPGRIGINLGQPVTLGRLKIADVGAKADVGNLAIAGPQPLTFEGSAPGQATRLEITQGKVPVGIRLDVSAGIRLGGTSPLTASVATPSVFDCRLSRLDLNGNTFTLEGARRFNPGDGWRGVNCQVGDITGQGAYIQNGSGTSVFGECPAFAGTLTVNNGDFSAVRLPAVAQYTVAGAFMEKNKYPRGGTLNIREFHVADPAAPPPPLLNPEATMVFPGGGYFIYNGCKFDEVGYEGTLRPVVVERLRQMQFLSGLTEIRMINGNHVSRSTTLLITDPKQALVRRPGATVLVGGDDIRSKQGYWGAMGLAEKLIFANGLSAHLKGGGGPRGSKNRSIIPWMTIGTIYHPGEGGWAAYDDEKGVHPLLEHEEYDDQLAGSPDRNVRCDELNLGPNQNQTVNSLIYGRWGNSDIGLGSTLKISSGGLIIGSMGKAAIGTTPGSGGTIDFGSAEGVIWSAWVTPYGDITIGANIAGTGGLTKTANGPLVLLAPNTYTGTTCVATSCLQVGDGKTPNAKLGDGDVEVGNGATLRIKSGVTNAIMDSATVALWNAGTAFFGRLDLEEGVRETVGSLVLAGRAQPAGTYGSASSTAEHKLDDYFTGSGVLIVTGAKSAKP